MVVLLTALLRQSPQMYEAEDLKARLAAAGGGGGEGVRRKRTVRSSPYEAPNCQESSQGPAAIAGGRSTISQRATTYADDTVSSSSDACVNIRDTSSRCRGTMKSPSATANSVRDAKVPNARKQPLTLVELLTAGVERPPHGPPRITTQHQSGQQSQHVQRQRSTSDIVLHQQHESTQQQQQQQQQSIHQQRHHQAGSQHYQQPQQQQQQLVQQQHQHESTPSRLAFNGERPLHEHCIAGRGSANDRSAYHQQQLQHSNTSTHCGNYVAAGDDIELGSRSCILQLLRCPPPASEDIKPRVWSSSVGSNHQHVAPLDAISAESAGRSQVAAAPMAGAAPGPAFATSPSTVPLSVSSSLTSTMGGEPLVAEADSSNLPLDEDLLSEMETEMLSDPVDLAAQHAPSASVDPEQQQQQQQHPPQHFQQQQLKSACSV